ncbi:uncharacterized protein N7482_007626 [Penicillium canariense]|uniref:DUF2293 domain-containing protein n=1 Tax=Penicillium canariense TaxID=189055 RepID=A0A9W9LJB6_9EURO|nr:uncharacterized protein N7482_007626 [Penicillium canariense]KAJ5160622.1 hypothetical protein N7482_007626 [Penicillium canariense]
MARVMRRAMSASTRRAPTRVLQRRPRKHKVIMESVTQEKKKLRSVICFEAQAPSGYTFIPAGNPLLTTACKERCRKDGLQVYAVSTTPHMRTHNLSQHVHRIGYHFPSTVVAAACSELGLYLTSAGKAVPFHTLGSLKEQPPANSEVDQITINTEARDAIRDLFPNIPDNDLNQIIKTAFQKGQRKVGTASELPLARRAQLAVVAHIRHLYTDYDRLLKQKSFHEARSEVEQVTLSKVIAWRGDDENGQTALEDVFREVIVISDDEDSETEEDGPAIAGTRDHSVEIFSSNPRTHEIQTQPISAVHASNQDPLREHSEEAPPGFRIVTRVPAQKAINRRGFNRYQAWNRALNRYRAEANGTQQTQIGSTSSEQQSPRYGKRPAPVHDMPDPPRRRDVAPHSMEIAPKVVLGPVYVDNPGQRLFALPPTDHPSGKSNVGAQERHAQLESQRTNTQHGSSGRTLTLTTQNSHELRHLEKNPHPVGTAGYPQAILHPKTNSNGRSERIPVPSNNGADAPMFVGGPQEPHHNGEHKFGPRTELPGSHYPRTEAPREDDAIPSIELIESPGLADKRRIDGRLAHLTNRMSLRSVTPVRSQGETSRHGPAAAPGSPDDQNCKRRRLAHYAAVPVSYRPDNWNTRPIGNPISEGPRGPYRRDEPLPGPYSQDRYYLRHDHPPPAEQPPVIGHHPERNPGSLGSPQVSLDAGLAIDRTRIADPYEPVPMHTKSGLTGTSGVIAAGDRTFRPAPNVSYPEVRPTHYDDRRPHLDRVRPAMLQESRLPVWRAFTDADRSVVHSASSDGKLYADDFVRPVDIREVRPVPVEYYVQRPRHQQPPRVEETRSQPARTRIPDHYVPKDLPHTQGPTEQRHPRSPRVAPASHEQAYRPPNTGSNPRDPHSKPSGASRERRPGSGLGAPRRVHDPRFFQMVEQNRPIYVQRVESQPPQYTVPEGRHIVIVD